MYTMTVLVDLWYQTVVLGSCKHDYNARILGPRREDLHVDENHAFDTVELLAHHPDQPGGRYQKFCTNIFKAGKHKKNKHHNNHLCTQIYAMKGTDRKSRQWQYNIRTYTSIRVWQLTSLSTFCQYLCCKWYDSCKVPNSWYYFCIRYLY